MSKMDYVEIDNPGNAQQLVQPAAISSRDGLRSNPGGNRTLYVLGFAIVGAMLANALVFIYFASFYVSG